MLNGKFSSVRMFTFHSVTAKSLRIIYGGRSMREIKLKGQIVNIKSNQNSETSEANESNLEESIKALGDEFNVDKVPKVKTIGDSKKK